MVVIEHHMSFKEFNGWKNIDGSAVSAEEIDRSFSHVMEQAKTIETEYISMLIRRRTRRIRRAVAIAAAVILLVVSPITAYLLFESHGSQQQMVLCTVSNGQTKEIVLSDGSRIILNAGSTLTYPEKFGKERRVNLSGEGAFFVSASRTSPFVVCTDNIEVTAYGTVFNVCNYPTDLSVCAALCSGAISVSRTDSDADAIVLSENQVLAYTKETGTTIVMNTGADESMTWKDGQMRIKSMPLEQVLKRVERKFDVNIHLTTDIYNSAVLTVKFVNDESLEQMMDTLCRLVPGMKYTIKDRYIYIQ